MNPHFIFNTLTSIQRMILEKDEFQASDFLAEFALLIRLTLENSNKPLHPLSEEVLYLETYLRLESLRFKDKMSYSIEVGERLNISQIKLPP